MLKFTCRTLLWQITSQPLILLWPNLGHRCIWGTFTQFCCQRSHAKVKGHLSSNVEVYLQDSLVTNNFAIGYPIVLLFVTRESCRSTFTFDIKGTLTCDDTIAWRFPYRICDPSFGHNRINGFEVMYCNICDGQTDDIWIPYSLPPPSVGETESGEPTQKMAAIYLLSALAACRFVFTRLRVQDL